MSGSDPAVRDRPFDDVSCPRCKVGAGAACVNADGTPRTMSHVSRGLEWVRQADEAPAAFRTHEPHDNGTGTDPSQ